MGKVDVLFLICVGVIGTMVLVAFASGWGIIDWVLAVSAALLIVGLLALWMRSVLQIWSYFAQEPERAKRALRKDQRERKMRLLIKHLGGDKVLVVCFGPERVPLPQEYHRLASQVALELEARGIRAMAAADHSEVALAIKNDPADPPQGGSPAEVLLESVKSLGIKYLLWLRKSWLVYQAYDGWRMYGFQQKGEILPSLIPHAATPQEVVDQMLDAMSTVEHIAAVHRQLKGVLPWEEMHSGENSESTAELPATSS